MTEDLDALREKLASQNGLRGLQVYTPADVEAVVETFYRDGFAVVRDALTPDQVAFLRAGCEREADAIMALDPDREGNRGAYRYSYGGASITRSILHRAEWRMLVDLPTVTPIVTAIFGSANYRMARAAGDFCMPGAVEYQRLHADIADHPDSFHDPRGVTTVRDLPCPVLVCNFLAQDFTPFNGPTRQIPGTQHSREEIPGLEEEPDWMKLSTVCPAPAGSVLIRDVRAWHGGTPNLSDKMRAIPNAMFVAPWFHMAQPPAMTRSMYEELSDHGKQLCRFLVTEGELETGFRVRPQ